MQGFLILKWRGGGVLICKYIWDLNRAHETERTVFPILSIKRILIQISACSTSRTTTGDPIHGQLFHVTTWSIHVTSYVNILIKIIYHIYPYKSPMSGRWGKSATRKEYRRKAACGHTCTATLTCKSIEIYISKINRIEQLFNTYRNIHANSYFISILIRVIVHHLS